MFGNDESEPRTRTTRAEAEVRGRERKRGGFFSFVENKEEIERYGREITISF